MRKKTSSSIICQNFKIHEQTIFQDFKCSYKSGLTYFGRLYIGQDHVLFISNMFGIIKKCVIAIESITKVEEIPKHSLLICDLQKGVASEYQFSGFKSNNAYVLVKALWKKQKIESKILNSHDEDDNTLPAQEIGSERLIDEGNVQSSFFNPNAVQAEKQKLCEFQLPCSVEQYYTFFLADNANVYSQKAHIQKKGGKVTSISDWKNNQELNSDVNISRLYQIKQINAVIKVSGVPFKSQAHMCQVWKLKKNDQQVEQQQCFRHQLFVEIVTQISDLPYSNHFVVNTFLTISKDGQKKSKMIVEMSIVFNKSTFAKSKILSRTIADLIDDYEFWFDKVKAALTQMRKSQENDSKSSRSGSVQYQADAPLLASQKKIRISMDSEHTTNQFDTSSTTQDSGILNKKVDKLTKLVYLLLAICLIQLFLTGFVLLGQSSSQTSEIVYYRKQQTSQEHINQLKNQIQNNSTTNKIEKQL